MQGVTADILRAIPLFRDLDAGALDQLASLARIRTCGPREEIVEQDQPGDAIYLIRQGRASVSVITRDGRHSTLGEMGPGEIIGEISLLDGGPRSATVTAITRTDLVCIDRASFLDMMSRTPGLAAALLAVVAARMRRLTRWADDLAGLPLPARLAKCLIALLSEYGQRTGPQRFRIGLKLSQHDLATRVGATRESINKHLRRWERGEILTHESGHLVITDVERLQMTAAGD